MKRKSFYNKLMRLDGKELLYVIAMIIIVFLLLPCCVEVLRIIFPNHIKNYLSADSILSYYGAMFGWIPTLVTSLIAIHQTKEKMELQKLVEIDKQRREDFPDIYVRNYRHESEKLSIEIENCSRNVAHNLIVFDNENIYCDEVVVLREREIKEIEIFGDFPKRIQVVYGDRSGNTIHREYIKNIDSYILVHTEYN